MFIKPNDALKNAAARYRAVIHNSEVGSTESEAERREWDGRIAVAEIELEAELIRTGVMKPEEGIEEISVVSGQVVVIFDTMRRYVIHLNNISAQQARA